MNPRIGLTARTLGNVSRAPDLNIINSMSRATVSDINYLAHGPQRCTKFKSLSQLQSSISRVFDILIVRKGKIKDQ